MQESSDKSAVLSRQVSAVQDEEKEQRQGRDEAAVTSRRMAGTVSPKKPSGCDNRSHCRNRSATRQSVEW